uniref:Uncharacterized protein n=1 Tax=Ditylenchus dipsaci TaxID=166011 RepID=A0A915E6X9_9BILA
MIQELNSKTRTKRGHKIREQSILIKDQSAAIREVWSAFWLSLTVVVLLSIVIIMMLGSRMLYGYKNARGYSYNSDLDICEV